MRRGLAKLCGLSLVGVMAGSIVTSCGGGSQTSSTRSPSSQTTVPRTSASSPAPTTTSPHALKTSFGDGTWVVGRDIAPGTYSTQTAGDCTYDSTSNSGGGEHGHSASGSNPAQVTVSIDPNDTAFTAHGCGTWVRQ